MRGGVAAGVAVGGGQRALSVWGGGAARHRRAAAAAVRAQGILVLQVGGWPAPFGITLAADLLSAAMVLVAGIVAVAVAVFALGSLDAGRERFGYYPLFHVLLMGVCGAFLSGDLFNLYVWFEVMLIASFVLLVLGGERPQLEGGVKYVTINLVSSAVVLAAAGITYGTVGTLNFADLARSAATLPHPGVARTLAMMMLIAFGVKAAIFPLFFWLPASYHTPPVAVTTLFSGLLTKVGVYALIRIFTLAFPVDAVTQPLLLTVAALTMITGVLGAVAQHEMRRLLAFHVVSQIGYLVMGLGLGSPLALAGAVFFIVHVTLAKSALFLVGGIAQRLRGSFELDRPGASIALIRGSPVVPRSGAGAGRHPAAVGVLGKLLLVQAGPSGSHWWVTGTALAVSLLTLFSMTKIWAAAFWSPLPEGATATAPRRGRCCSARRRRRSGCSPSRWASGPNRRWRWRSRPRRSWRTRRRTSPPCWGAMSVVTWIGRAIGFAGFFAWELLLANLRVTSLVLRPTAACGRRSALPLDVRSDAAIQLLAATITLTPGTLSIDVSSDRRTLYVHVVDLGRDVEAFGARPSPISSAASRSGSSDHPARPLVRGAADAGRRGGAGHRATPARAEPARPRRRARPARRHRHRHPGRLRGGRRPGGLHRSHPRRRADRLPRHGGVRRVSRTDERR
jgi:multicomponent Na+:H+ antiporter subunit D